jgi:iron(III) transport system substrate-binding protein
MRHRLGANSAGDLPARNGSPGVLRDSLDHEKRPRDGSGRLRRLVAGAWLLGSASSAARAGERAEGGRPGTQRLLGAGLGLALIASACGSAAPAASAPVSPSIAASAKPASSAANATGASAKPAGSTAAASAKPAGSAAPSAKPAASGGAAGKPAGSGGPSAAAKPSGPSAFDTNAIKSEGKVSGYGVLVDSQFKTLNDLMEKNYGIGVEPFRGDTATIMSRIDTEESAGKHLWDFSVLEAPFQDQLVQKKYLQKLPAGLEERFPEKWRDPNGYYATFTLYPLTIIYNTDLVPKGQEPKSFDDLLDPKWKGKIAMTDPVLNEAFLRWFEVMREARGAGADDFFQKLNANNPTFFQSGLTVSTNVNQGQFPLGIGFMTHVLSVGGPNGHMNFVPLNPMYATSGAFALSANAPHPNAAKATADLFLSSDYLQASADLGYPVTLPGLKSAIPGADSLNFELIPEFPEDKFNSAQTYFKGIFKK